jgi:hypothetical protein
MISHEKKFAFIHIPKTAGVSILTCLEQYRDEEKFKVGHNTQKIYLEFLNTKSYTQFSVVRNPWDRLVSAFFYLKRGGVNMLDKQAARQLSLKNISFLNFLKKLNPLNTYDHFKTQLSWFDEEISSVNFLKFETIQKDFNLICKKIQITPKVLPYKNKTKHKHYTEYYNDETRQIVAEKYAKDIEYFGYKFGE